MGCAAEQHEMSCGCRGLGSHLGPKASDTAWLVGAALRAMPLRLDELVLGPKWEPNPQRRQDFHGFGDPMLLISPTSRGVRAGACYDARFSPRGEFSTRRPVPWSVCLVYLEVVLPPPDEGLAEAAEVISRLIAFKSPATESLHLDWARAGN